MGKETLLSKINFEVVWRWKRKLASELVQKQWGGTTVFWNMLQRSLLEFKRAVQTGLLCLCPTESMWQGFKSITEAEVDADYYQSLVIWLYKMISLNWEDEKQLFRKFTCELTQLIFTIWFNLREKKKGVDQWELQAESEDVCGLDHGSNPVPINKVFRILLANHSGHWFFILFASTK